MIMSGRDARGPNMSATEWRAPSKEFHVCRTAANALTV
jgi:hypothetical protein